MSDDERRAESALRCIANGTWNVGTGRILSAREFAREALDRVRDARGDDEGRNRGAGFTERMTGELDAVAGWNRRSPQGEDHEAGRLAKLADWLERDRREPDKVIAYAQEVRRLARVSAPKADENQEAR